MSVTVATDLPASGVPHHQLHHHPQQQQQQQQQLHPGKDGVAAGARGVLRLGATARVPVTLQDKSLKDTARKRHGAKCWVVPKAEVERLLGRPYQSYVVDRL